MPRAAKKPPLTDAERHARFVETARQVEASEKSEDFDRAFDKIAAIRMREPPKQNSD
jgi:hypothetical protein